MAETSTCPHNYPSPFACIDCMNDGNLPPTTKRRVRRNGWPFAAMYPGPCSGCDAGIEEGEQIVRMEDDTYRHVGECEKTLT